MKRLPVEFVQKGWGYESWIENKPEYCGKLLFFKKGKQCSFHYHREKVETFFISKGKLNVIYVSPDRWDHKFHEIKDENDARLQADFLFRSLAVRVELEEGDVFDVPRFMIHQMYGVLDTYVYEFSTEHFEEDSIRVIKGD